MAIDYGLIGRFNQVQPGGLTQAFRGGVDLRGQMTQNQRQGQALIADQFANQQAPILADRATQVFGQETAVRQANEQNLLTQAQAKQAEIQQKKIEADQKRYTDSMSIMGRSLYSVNDESQVPVVLNSLKTMADSGVINPDVFYNIPGVKEGRMPSLQEVKVISQSLIDTKDQLIQEREKAKAQREAEQQLIDNALKNKEFGLKEKEFKETVRKNKASETIERLKAQRIGNAEVKQSETVKANIANQFRDEYDNKSKNYFTSVGAYNTLKSLAKDSSGQSDMALVFTFMKALDPTSTVREGEYASAQNAPGVSEKVRNQYNKVMDGELLTKKGRDGFVSTAKTIVDSNAKAQKDLETTYEDYANQYGINPKQVVGKKTDLINQETPPPAGAFKTKTGVPYEVVPE